MPEVEYGLRDGVARITINRPERRNAMSFDVMQLLCDALDRVAGDDAARVVVLTGAGERAFCAGADLGSIGSDTSVIEAHRKRGLLADVFRQLWKLEKPSLARVRGFSLAGGFGLASAGDFA